MLNPQPSPSGSSPHAPLSPLPPQGKFSRERVLALLIGVAILAGAWLTRDYWVPVSMLYSKRETTPDGLSWVKFGTTRRELLEKLAAAGNTWDCIVRPGMAPNAWVSHSNVTIGGKQLDDFSVLFSDSQKYDYGAIPSNGQAVLGVKELLGASSPDGKIVAIRAKYRRSYVEANSPVVPAEVLRELGLPHSEKPDIVGQGKLFEWKWPNVTATFLSLPGQLSLQQVDAASKIDVNAGPGNLPAMGPPAESQEAPAEDSDSALESGSRDAAGNSDQEVPAEATEEPAQP